MAINFNRDNTGIFSVNDVVDNDQMAGLFGLFGKSDEEKVLEQIQDLRNQQNTILGPVQGDVDLLKDNEIQFDKYQDIQKQIQNLQQQFPKDTSIQEASLINEYGFPLTASYRNTVPNQAFDFNELVNNQPMSLRDFAPVPGLQSTGVGPFPGLQRTGIMTPQIAKDTIASNLLYDDMAPVIDTFFGVANQPDVQETDEYEVDKFGYRKQPSGIARLFDFLGNIPTPFNLARKGLGSLRGLNNRIQGSDFAQSKTLADYFDARSYGGRQARDDARARNMAQARGIQKGIDRGDFDGPDREDRDRGSVTEKSAGKSKGVGGGGYTSSDSNRESYRGR